MHTVEQWLAQVQGLMHMWRSIKVACICVRVGDGWINLAGLATLTDEAPSTGFAVEPVAQADELLALFGYTDIATLSNLVQNLTVGQVFSAGTPYPVKLFLDENKKGNWYEPRLQDRAWTLRDLGIDFTAVTVHYMGPEIREMVAERRHAKIDEILRLSTPPFDGTAGLARKLGLKPLAESGGTSYFELAAVIPLRFRTIVENLTEKNLTASVEARPTIDISLASVNGVYSIDESAVVLGDLKSWSRKQTDDWLLCEKTVRLTHTSGRIKLILAYAQTRVEIHEHYLAAIDAWARACEFFDPEFKNLASLVNATEKINVSALELGAARLLATAGFRVAWFGKRAAPRKGDILAAHTSADGRTVFVTLECTEENPTAKIARANREAEALKSFIDDEAIQVIPAIFTSAQCSSADYQQSRSQGVALITPRESDWILQGIRAGKKAKEIVALIKRLISPTGITLADLNF